MPGLLYPAYQKFYSAIRSLKRFSTENNFFDNISSLDTFFSEYRSTTLVMQKSLAHTSHFETYEKVSAGIWDAFFNTQRVKAIHTHPVEFTKGIDIKVYFPNTSMEVTSRQFTVENDIPLSSLVEELKEFFRALNPIEVFFSVKFSFVEKDSGVDLWDKLTSGVATMQKFMDTMYSEIGEKCPLCDELRAQIDKTGYSLLPKDFFLVNDYVYYPEKEEFERAGRLALVLPGTGDKTIKKFSIKRFMESPHFNSEITPFDKFVSMHVIIGASDLMPTIMTVYKDETYDLDTFHADIKTTVYRKVNETAEQILQGNVKEVYFMTTYVVVEYQDNLLNLTSKERLMKGSDEYLAFMKVDCDLNETEYAFDGEYITQMEYVVKQMRYGKKDKLDFGAVNMLPIIEAFKSLKEESEEQ